MPDLVKKPIGTYPTLANGPLSKPEGMRGLGASYLKKMSFPLAFGSLAIFGTCYVSNIHVVCRYKNFFLTVV